MFRDFSKERFLKETFERKEIIERVVLGKSEKVILKEILFLKEEEEVKKDVTGYFQRERENIEVENSS